VWGCRCGCGLQQRQRLRLRQRLWLWPRLWPAAAAAAAEFEMSRRRPSPRPTRSVVDLANASSFEERTRLIEAQQRRAAGRRSPSSPRRRAVWVDGASFDEAALVGKRVRLLDGADDLDGHIEGRVASWKGAIGKRNGKGGYHLELDNGTRLKNIKLAHASCQHKDAHHFEVFQAVRWASASSRCAR
jgi:hypothetical protein